MGTTVDSIDIQIAAQAQKANTSLDALVRRLDKMNSSLSRAGGTGMAVMANGVGRLASAMQQMDNVKTSDFTRLTNNLEKLGNVDVNKIRSSAVALAGLTKSLSNLSTANGSAAAGQIGDLAKGIAQLGYNSSTQAVENIPKLAVAMKELMNTLSGAPKVSQNLIDMTNALASLARTGASSGRAANSLATSLNTYSSSTKRAKTHTFSLSSAFGKLYATYWLVFRGIGKIMDSINFASDLQEVNNVVLQTFGQYSGILNEMAATSIQDFGISELTTKKIASRFQSMGTAMGFTQGKMADMSISLTKLAADMASFYNVEASEMATSLQSIFTGETEPMRRYGIDLTQATLQQWALKNGIDATVSSMSQQDKTMLRYQYVMANTAAAQGDFARTSDSWANTLRRLTESFNQLGTIVGTTLISAFKPLLNGLSNVVQKVISFVQTIANALGAIFGWTLEIMPSGAVSDATSGLEDIGSAADGAGGSLGGAADKAKELMDILSFDEINKLSDLNEDSGGGSGGGGGGSGAGSSDGGATAEFVRTESLIDRYKSNIESLYELGHHIGSTLQKTLEGINWDSVYKKADEFGFGLADFLNGLIYPQLFSAVGASISNSLNTALHGLNSFGHRFNWTEFGESIAAGINSTFLEFDFALAGDTVNVWLNGILDSLIAGVKDVKWREIGEKIADFFENIEWDKIFSKIGTLIWETIKGVITAYGSLFTAAPIETIILTAIGLLKFTGLKGSIGTTVWGMIKTALTGKAAEKHASTTAKSLGDILLNALKGAFDDLSGGLSGTGGLGNLVANAGTIFQALGGIGSPLAVLFDEEMRTYMKNSWSQFFEDTGPFWDEAEQYISDKTTELQKYIEENPLRLLPGFTLVEEGVKAGENIWEDVTKFLDGLKDTNPVAEFFSGEGAETPEIEVVITGNNTELKKAVDDSVNYSNKNLPNETVVEVDADTTPTEKTYGKLQRAFQRGKNPLEAWLVADSTGLREQLETIGNSNELNVPANISTKPYALLSSLQKPMNAFQLMIGAKIGTSANKLQSEVGGKFSGYAAQIQAEIATPAETIVSEMQGSIAGIGLDINATANVNKVDDGLSDKQKTFGTTAEFNKQKNSLSEKEKTFNTIANFVSRVLGLSEKEKTISTIAKYIDSQDGLTTKEKLINAVANYSSAQFGNLSYEDRLVNVYGKIKELIKPANVALTLSATVSSIGNALRAVFNEDGGIYSGNSWKPITAFAGGGLPTEGQYFIAREAGPELVGTIGGHTAVMNNDQIVSSVASGVATAVGAVMSQFMSNGQVTEVHVHLEGDAKGVFRVVKQENDRIVRSTGRPALLV